MIVPQERTKQVKLWMPKRVVFTADAIKEDYGQEIYARIKTFNLPVEVLKTNRVTGLRGSTPRETYKISKSTLAIVNAPAGAFKLTPIPPSADWQFHLAEGCPAHCQYCYLAGSLAGPPAIRVFANLPEILNNLPNFEQTAKVTSFEASCYTDPVGIEHLTGGLEKTIRYFGLRPQAHLRFVTKFNAIESLLHLPHNGRTRWRVSLNAGELSARLEMGTASIKDRMQALRTLALPLEQGGGNYPIGVIIAPIMPIPDWKEQYSHLIQELRNNLNFPCDLTFEFISHRFTPGSKNVLMEWYPNTSLEMDESTRSVKRNKFGGIKYVYKPESMASLKSFFHTEIRSQFPDASILYWT